MVVTAGLGRVRLFVLSVSKAVCLNGGLFSYAGPFLGAVHSLNGQCVFLAGGSSEGHCTCIGQLTNFNVRTGPSSVFASKRTAAVCVGRTCPGTGIYIVKVPSLARRFRRTKFAISGSGPSYVIMNFSARLGCTGLARVYGAMGANVPCVMARPSGTYPMRNKSVPSMKSLVTCIRTTAKHLPRMVNGPGTGLISTVIDGCNITTDGVTVIKSQLTASVSLTAGSRVSSVLMCAKRAAERRCGISGVHTSCYFSSLTTVRSTLLNWGLVASRVRLSLFRHVGVMVGELRAISLAGNGPMGRVAYFVVPLLVDKVLRRLCNVISTTMVNGCYKLSTCTTIKTAKPVLFTRLNTV